MRQRIYFTPGPSQTYYTVPQHLKDAQTKEIMSISHRSSAFKDLYAETISGLKELLQLPDGYEVYFLSSANEIWERIIQNLVGSSSHHFINGSFAQKFYEFAQAYQKNSSATISEDGNGFNDLSVPQKAELISVTLNETSIGFGFDIEDLKEIRRNNPNAIIALDGVSAFPCIPINMELADTAYFSVQKCFGLPSGLGVWVVNKRCIEQAKKLEKSGLVTGSYHSLLQLKAFGDKYQTPETPNTLGIYLLNAVVKDFLFRGLKSIQNETAYKSAVLYQALEKSNSLEPFVKETSKRSKTVIVAKCTKGNTSILDQFAGMGMILGKGYGKYKDEHIRIANFPVHSKEQIELISDHLSQL